MSRALRSASLLAVRPRPAAIVRPCYRYGSSSTSHGHADAHADAEVYPEEGFNAPFWSKLAVAGLAVALFLRISPDDLPNKIDPSHSETPYLTRYIAHNLTPQADLWKERNEKHLELAVKAADDKLLFQEAERPKVRRMRYLGTFAQASPNGIMVGSQADLTDLKIKSEHDDLSYGKEAAEAEDDE